MFSEAVGFATATLAKINYSNPATSADKYGEATYLISLSETENAKSVCFQFERSHLKTGDMLFSHFMPGVRLTGAICLNRTVTLVFKRSQDERKLIICQKNSAII